MYRNLPFFTGTSCMESAADVDNRPYTKVKGTTLFYVVHAVMLNCFEGSICELISPCVSFVFTN